RTASTSRETPRDGARFFPMKLRHPDRCARSAASTVMPRLHVLTSAGLGLLAWVGIAAAQPLPSGPGSPGSSGATASGTTYATERVFPDLAFTHPVAVVAPPGEADRLFVVEKPGRI